MSSRDRRDIHLRPLSAWALRAASLLRDAGEDGVPYAEMRDELGIDPENVMEELRRHRYVIGEQHDVYYLVHEPPAAAVSTPSPIAALPAPRRSDMPERLFEPDTTHFRAEAA